MPLHCEACRKAKIEFQISLWRSQWTFDHWVTFHYVIVRMEGLKILRIHVQITIALFNWSSEVHALHAHHPSWILHKLLFSSEDQHMENLIIQPQDDSIKQFLDENILNLLCNYGNNSVAEKYCQKSQVTFYHIPRIPEEWCIWVIICKSWLTAKLEIFNKNLTRMFNIVSS